MKNKSNHKKNKNARVVLRMTSDDKEQLIKKAKESNLTISEIIRVSLHKNKIQATNIELLYQINKIDNTLIRIAKHCSASRSIDIAALSQLTLIETLIRRLII